MDRYYPDITDTTIVPFLVVRDNLIDDRDYLSAPECPYSERVKLFLQTLTGGQEAADSPLLAKSGDKWAYLETETAQLYENIKLFGQALDAEDTSERLQWFKTMTSLLEKIVSINERALGLRQIHQFQETVLTAIEDELDPGQRTKLIERLRNSINRE